MKQMRGLIIGGDEDHIESSARLQEQDLVLVDNLKVCMAIIQVACGAVNTDNAA
jgi:hypothetical protein